MYHKKGITSAIVLELYVTQVQNPSSIKQGQ